MLENVGPKLADKLTVLVVDLHLMRGRPLGDNDVAALPDHRHPVRVEQLTIPFAALAKLELETALLVENLQKNR